MEKIKDDTISVSLRVIDGNFMYILILFLLELFITLILYFYTIPITSSILFISYLFVTRYFFVVFLPFLVFVMSIILKKGKIESITITKTEDFLIISSSDNKQYIKGENLEKITIKPIFNSMLFIIIFIMVYYLVFFPYLISQLFITILLFVVELLFFYGILTVGIIMVGIIIIVFIRAREITLEPFMYEVEVSYSSNSGSGKTRFITTVFDLKKVFDVFGVSPYSLIGEEIYHCDIMQRKQTKTLLHIGKVFAVLIFLSLLVELSSYSMSLIEAVFTLLWILFMLVYYYHYFYVYGLEYIFKYREGLLFERFPNSLSTGGEFNRLKLFVDNFKKTLGNVFINILKLFLFFVFVIFAIFSALFISGMLSTVFGLSFIIVIVFLGISAWLIAKYPGRIMPDIETIETYLEKRAEELSKAYPTVFQCFYDLGKIFVSRNSSYLIYKIPFYIAFFAAIIFVFLLMSSSISTDFMISASISMLGYFFMAIIVAFYFDSLVARIPVYFNEKIDVFFKDINFVGIIKGRYASEMNMFFLLIPLILFIYIYSIIPSFTLGLIVISIIVPPLYYFTHNSYKRNIIIISKKTRSSMDSYSTYNCNSLPVESIFD